MGQVVMGPRKTLEWAIVRYLDEHHPAYGIARWSLPPGIRIEMHPSTYNLVRSDSDIDYPQVSLTEKMGIPVKINPDLGQGEWRLVVVTEDVKTGGRFS